MLFGGSRGGLGVHPWLGAMEPACPVPSSPGAMNYSRPAGGGAAARPCAAEHRELFCVNP